MDIIVVAILIIPFVWICFLTYKLQKLTEELEEYRGRTDLLGSASQFHSRDIRKIEKKISEVQDELADKAREK